MKLLKAIIAFILLIISFVYGLYVLGRFIAFLSIPKSIPKIYSWVFDLLDNKSRLETAYGAIVFDSLYIIGFIIQHSFMKTDFVKKIFEKLGLATVSRAIYSLTSSLCLNYLIQHWMPAQSVILWQIDVDNNEIIWWAFVIAHAYGWLVICSGTIIFDLADILGIKQVYYNMKGRGPPSVYKSRELNSLHAHYPHPSFVGFSIVFWITNLMTLDRLLLSLMLTTYMYCCWSPTRSDVAYQKFQLKMKGETLFYRLRHKLRYS